MMMGSGGKAVMVTEIHRLQPPGAPAASPDPVRRRPQGVFRNNFVLRGLRSRH